MRTTGIGILEKQSSRFGEQSPGQIGPGSSYMHNIIRVFRNFDSPATCKNLLISPFLEPRVGPAGLERSPSYICLSALRSGTGKRMGAFSLSVPLWQSCKDNPALPSESFSILTGFVDSVPKASDMALLHSD